MPITEIERLPIGTLVRVKSGGPPMIVVDIATDDYDNILTPCARGDVICAWRSKAGIIEAKFVPHVLTVLRKPTFPR
ncbi:DUF2158 domain-containing protein [Manganibacter manganicus]|uniref:Uncharacterized protein n=1 Tax=Manganibacter manganicus TaxID=1873176 RepID=A0A1V8RR11_9HYPH|nr:DUF2158 domain-containing protein [Pseudaminobacter manganicus]OQM75588.1 hypothetical protein BFN67_17600 [Pseudaminobacter manganicus]